MRKQRGREITEDSEMRNAAEMRNDGELCPVGGSLTECRRTLLHISGEKGTRTLKYIRVRASW